MMTMSKALSAGQAKDYYRQEFISVKENYYSESGEVRGHWYGRLGEEWGLKWDFNRLVEAHDVDFVRSTLPNVGGITELMKVLAICETHAVGIIPHFTGPIATAALVNCLSTFSGPVLMEYNYGGRPIDYLPECLDFKNGKAYTNQRPGLGVTADINRLTLIGEITEPGRKNMYRRPDGSLTHW